MKNKPINVYTGNKTDDEKYIKELVERRRKAYQDEGVVTYVTESEMNEDLANNTGEFVDWLLDTIRNDMHKCSKLKDSKGLSALNFLLNKIEDKLAEE